MHGPVNVRNAFTCTLSGCCVSVAKNLIPIINTFDSRVETTTIDRFSEMI